MEEKAYAVIRDHQARHWWFRGRSRIVSRVLLAGIEPNPECRILDLGAGFGGMIPLLNHLGQVEALEPYPGARDALEETGALVRIGDIESVLTEHRENYDMITLFDVLEHIEDDARAVQLIHRALKPDGLLILTVPAMPLLWSVHDDLHQHHRRYTKKRLKALLDPFFSLDQLSYYNSFLWPLALLERRLIRPKADQGTEIERSFGFFNELLYRIFIAEIPFLKMRFPFPFGVSLLGRGRKVVR